MIASTSSGVEPAALMALQRPRRCGVGRRLPPAPQERGDPGRVVRLSRSTARAARAGARSGRTCFSRLSTTSANCRAGRVRIPVPCCVHTCDQPARARLEQPSAQIRQSARSSRVVRPRDAAMPLEQIPVGVVSLVNPDGSHTRLRIPIRSPRSSIGSDPHRMVPVRQDAGPRREYSASWVGLPADGP